MRAYKIVAGIIAVGMTIAFLLGYRLGLFDAGEQVRQFCNQPKTAIWYFDEWMCGGCRLAEFVSRWDFTNHGVPENKTMGSREVQDGN
jgi:hypothetical protein